MCIGTVNGDTKAVSFTVNDNEFIVEYLGDGHQLCIPLKRIIAVTPEDYKRDRWVLYVSENTTDDASRGLPYLLKSLDAFGLPKAFVDEFAIPLWRRDPEGEIVMSPQILVSVGSGTHLAGEVYSQLLAPLFPHLGFSSVDEYSVEVQFTTSDTSITENIRDVVIDPANAGVAQLIVLLSGDGGLVDIVNALLSHERDESYKKPCIVLLPCGTGNAMANSCGILGNDGTFGLSTMLRGTPKEVPLFKATFSPGARLLANEGQEEQAHGQGAAPQTVPVYQSPYPPLPATGQSVSPPSFGAKETGVAYGAVVCSWALHAEIVADSDTTEYRKFGAARFQMAAKKALSSPHAYKGKLSILRPGQQEWQALKREEHGYVLATLCSQLDKGFTISPRSKPLDGQLRLVHFAHLKGEDVLDIMQKAYRNGEHIDDIRVCYSIIDGLRIDFDEDDGRWRRVCIDGKIFRVEKGGWVEIRGGVGGVVDLMISKGT